MVMTMKSIPLTLAKLSVTGCAAVLLFNATGCGTMVAHSPIPGFGDPIEGRYTGVRNDLKFAVSPATRDPKHWPGVLFTTPLALIDMPFSALFDTWLVLHDELNPGRNHTKPRAGL
jgi:uncharacterized protein YceK